MTIKPIDIQTNIAQMTEVGRGEQARTEGVVEQQHVLEKESSDKSKLADTTLDESKKAEKTAIRDNDDEAKKKEKEKFQGKGKETEKEENEKKRKLAKDDRMGQIIDVLK